MRGWPLERIEYRALSPLFHDQPFTVNDEPRASGTEADVWTASADGQYAMRATVRFCSRAASFLS